MKERKCILGKSSMCEVMVWFKYDIRNSAVGEGWGQVLL